MKYKLIVLYLFSAAIFFAVQAHSQSQTCPININFSSGDISSWSAETGLINHATKSYPAPNSGVTTIPEYSITTTGVQVITSSFNDTYGGFPTIPTINGYSYNYSIKIGSNATSWDLQPTTSNPGGFFRSVTYQINVPAGPTSVPYTMTYAYAMVLENGTHNSNEQPMFKATLSTPDSIVTCASPQYYLPTFNNAGGGTGSTGATLDTATAIANGFSLSSVPFLSHAGVGGANGNLLYDVWTKGWTEVTFDLSAYRGQQVTLTFEADNCVPGAHFAYAYVALRNNCAGLQISGSPIACTNSTLTYSIPALANGSYDWTVPTGWTISSGANSNIIKVIPGALGGLITAHEVNGCADLRDTVSVTTTPPTVAGQVITDNTVCSGTNSTLLNLNGQVGDVLNWISSTDGVNWVTVPNTTNSYTAQDLTATTQYEAIVQNGSTCSIDTSAAAVVTVDPKSVGGVLSPDNSSFCLGQSTSTLLSLSGDTGSVQNWQISNDSVNWSDFIPANTDSVYYVSSVNATTYYRAILKSGVCPADTSAVATINFVNTPFPDATIDPANASICYGQTIPLNATINTGTTYTWSHSNTLMNYGTGVVTTLPTVINAIASPPGTIDYVLTVNNAGCPNPLMDTFHVAVSPRIIVFAGNDTSIVVGQSLQFNATVNDSAANQFNWTPATGLDFPDIYNPVGTYSGSEAGGTITYIVRATDAAGCYGEDDIKVTIFETGPDIFVPSAFTPNGDGKNDIIKPICVGISKLNFFRIYNRWGQLVFNTSQIGVGWDGTINGTPQATSNFVYMAQGIDYTGKIIFKKGNIVLIR